MFHISNFTRGDQYFLIVYNLYSKLQPPPKSTKSKKDGILIHLLVYFDYKTFDFFK